MSIYHYLFPGIVIIGVVFFVGYFCYHTSVQYEMFKKEGIKTEAKILSMKQIGRSGTGNTKLRMQLEFETEQGTVQVTAKEFFTLAELIDIKKKHTVLIYYLPQDPKRIFLAAWEMDELMQ